MKPEIIRKYLHGGTNGILLIDGKEICKTIELPWKDNKTGISCIPEGEYELRRRYSPKFGRHLILREVPGRELVLIHPANNALKELRGCIAPVSTLTGPGTGAESRKALRKVLNAVYGAIDAGEQVLLLVRGER